MTVTKHILLIYVQGGANTTLPALALAGFDCDWSLFFSGAYILKGSWLLKLNVQPQRGENSPLSTTTSTTPAPVQNETCIAPPLTSLGKLGDPCRSSHYFHLLFHAIFWLIWSW